VAEKYRRLWTLKKGGGVPNIELRADLSAIRYSKFAVVALVLRNPGKPENIHTSGHATVDDLKRLVEAISPKAVIPIHTQHPDRYAEHFPNVRQLSDGQGIEI
jgi:mRNA degradation ribonuclease J1/J2